jgi:polyisoprenoid-binding protein YceI
MNQGALLQVLKNYSMNKYGIENQTKWSIDPVHSEISFKVRHLMISHVNGGFKSFDASIYTNNKDFTSTELDLWIEADSLSTGDSKRDEHLKGVDFLDVAQHKQISFSSSTIGTPDRDGNAELWGELTIIGIKKMLSWMQSSAAL